MYRRQPPEILALQVLILGTLIWAAVTAGAIYFDSFAGVQRAGTLLISAGVTSLALSRNFYGRALEALEVASKSYTPELSAKVRENTDTISEIVGSEKAQSLLTIFAFFDKIGSPQTVVSELNRFIFLVEIMTIVLGTLQTGYGDLTAKFLFGVS